MTNDAATGEPGGEAEELRRAIETLIEELEPETGLPEDLLALSRAYALGRQDAAREIGRQLREILDRVDARDSLAFLEAQRANRGREEDATDATDASLRLQA